MNELPSKDIGEGSSQIIHFAILNFFKQSVHVHGPLTLRRPQNLNLSNSVKQMSKVFSLCIPNIKMGSQVINIGCTFKNVQGTPMLMYSVHTLHTRSDA